MQIGSKDRVRITGLPHTSAGAGAVLVDIVPNANYIVIYKIWLPIWHEPNSNMILSIE